LIHQYLTLLAYSTNLNPTICVAGAGIAGLAALMYANWHQSTPARRRSTRQAHQTSQPEKLIFKPDLKCASLNMIIAPKLKDKSPKNPITIPPPCCLVSTGGISLTRVCVKAVLIKGNPVSWKIEPTR
jgi:hypothetical protein